MHPSKCFHYMVHNMFPKSKFSLALALCSRLTVGIPWQAFAIIRIFATLPIGIMMSGMMSIAARAVQRIHFRRFQIPFRVIYAAIIVFLVGGNVFVGAVTITRNETRWNGVSIMILALLFMGFGLTSAFLFYM